MKLLHDLNQKQTVLLHCGILTLVLAVMILVIRLAHPGTVYGAQTDWSNQHFAIPEYFRTRFYATGNFFPNLALHLGGGQNIYNFAYYGLYSPVNLLSYCFPWVTMATYLQIASICTTWISTILCYIWIHKWFPSKMAFFLSLLFLTAAPVIFHSHHHIMYVNYMPFLFWGLLSIHRALERGRSGQFILAAICILLSSFFFSVGAFAVLLCYALFLALHWHHVHIARQCLRAVSIALLHLALAVTIAMFLLLPIVLTLLSGRDATSESTSLWKLLMPSVHLRYFTYSPFSIGLTAVSILSIAGTLHFDRSSYRFLSLLFTVLLWFPSILYFMNGTMYLDPKAYIPFLPLLLLLCGAFLSKLFARQIPYRFTLILFSGMTAIGLLLNDGTKPEIIAAALDNTVLLIALVLFRKYNQRWIILAPTIAFSLAVCFCVNLGDTYMKKEDLDVVYAEEIQQLTDDISEKDSSFYRISNEYHAGDTVNRIWGANYYRSSVYSSIHNATFSNFYFQQACNENGIRNKTMMVQSKNPIFNMLMGEKYVITQTPITRYGYRLTTQKGDYLLYENTLAFPIGFATSHVITKEALQEIGYPMQLEVLLENAVVNAKNLPDATTATSAQYPDETQKITPVYTTTDWNPEQLTKIGDSYYVHSEEPFTITVTLEQPISALLLLKLHVDNHLGSNETTSDVSVTVNGVRNKLTDPDWKYQNDNQDFQYTLSSDTPIQTLKFSFSKGNYILSDISMYTLDYDVLRRAAKQVDAWQISHDTIGDDTLQGKIDVQKDGWFVLSIPYDEGFQITIDGQETSYFPTDTGFLGCPISEGMHDIRVAYTAPGFFEGKWCSVLGICCSLCYLAGWKFHDLQRAKKQSHLKSI